MEAKFRMIKKEIRVLGIAWTTPSRRSLIPAQVVGVVFRGSRWLEGVMRKAIPLHVTDMTSSIAAMVTRSPHFPQLRVIVTDGLVTKTGRYLDIDVLNQKTGLPVIAVLRRKVPTKCLSSSRTRRSQKRKAPAKWMSSKWMTEAGTLFVYSAGLGDIDLCRILEVCASKGGIPEATRIARIIASSLEKFMSRHQPTDAYLSTDAQELR